MKTNTALMIPTGLFWGGLLMVLFCSCRTQNLFQQDATASKNGGGFPLVDSGYEYTIRTGDKISISIWDHDDLSVGSLYGIYNSNEVYGKWLLVDARGEINIPRTGVFSIRGLTVTDAEDSLRVLFSQWIKKPVVEIKVLNKEVSMLGELKTPGKILLDKDNNTLVELIARAGDFDFYANKRHIQIIRITGDKARMLSVDLTSMDAFTASNIRIIPGDIIYVPSKRGKDFDKRLATIMPIISAITGAAIVYKAFF